MMFRSAVTAYAATLLLAACAPRAPEAPLPAAAEYTLPTPHVTMSADPAPDFTYWAPEGSTITNHPHVPGVWYADLDGRRVETYFGDACRASEFQRYIGTPVSAFPAVPEGVELRTSCTTCAVSQDLRANRLNVILDETTQRITKIACY